MYACNVCNVCTYVRMYVCTYVRMYLCMYVCTYVCMYLCMYVSMYVCMYACMYVCIDYIYIYKYCLYYNICKYKSLYIYINKSYIYIYIANIFIHIYIYIYIYIYISTIAFGPSHTNSFSFASLAGRSFSAFPLSPWSRCAQRRGHGKSPVVTMGFKYQNGRKWRGWFGGTDPFLNLHMIRIFIVIFGTLQLSWIDCLS